MTLGALTLQIGTRLNQTVVEGEVNESTAIVESSQADPSQSEEGNLAKMLRVSMMKFHRAQKEPCVIPNKLLHRISVGSEGAFTLSFSNAGTVLAIGTMSSDSSSNHFINGYIQPVTT